MTSSLACGSFLLFVTQLLNSLYLIFMLLKVLQEVILLLYVCLPTLIVLANGYEILAHSLVLNSHLDSFGFKRLKDLVTLELVSHPQR